MSKKTISKVIIYYEDGTYEEVKASFSPVQNKQDKSPITPHHVDFRPDWQKVKEWQEPAIPRPTWVAPTTDPSLPPWTITCGTDSVPFSVAAGKWSFTSTGNFANDNKYTITSTGNGNVDISK
jgi:hypothetical protein